jgi:hypothetical protein
LIERKESFELVDDKNKFAILVIFADDDWMMKMECEICNNEFKENELKKVKLFTDKGLIVKMLCISCFNKSFGR